MDTGHVETSTMTEEGQLPLPTAKDRDDSPRVPVFVCTVLGTVRAGHQRSTLPAWAPSVRVPGQEPRTSRRLSVQYLLALGTPACILTRPLIILQISSWLHIVTDVMFLAPFVLLPGQKGSEVLYTIFCLGVATM